MTSNEAVQASETTASIPETIPETMKAAVLRDLEAGLKIETLRTPRPKAGEVLIKVAACGLWPPLAGLGTLVYLGGACAVLVPAYRTARRVPPTSFATASAAASVAWFVGLFAILGARMALADDAAAAREVIHSLRLPLAAGFALQILVAALSYLTPVMLGGGPAAPPTPAAAGSQLDGDRPTPPSV